MEWNGMEWNGMEWNHGIMESWNHGIIESWNHGIMESWNHGIMESWNYIMFLMYFISFLRVFRISRSDCLYSRLYFLMERRWFDL